MARALEPHLLIGMPHLTPHGLSETWLMKELGHRHWLMLTRDLGMDNADFPRMEMRSTQPFAPHHSPRLASARSRRTTS